MASRTQRHMSEQRNNASIPLEMTSNGPIDPDTAIQNPKFLHDPESAAVGVKYSKRDWSEVNMDRGHGTGNGSAAGVGSVLSAHKIDYWVKVSSGCCKSEDKQILTNISAVFKQGMSAIMGPTGSGKSSFLDVLAGRKDPAGVRGHLLLDGKPVPENFKCMVGYVVQDDVVMGTLTVRENFAFSAALRLPSSVKAEERKQRVKQVIKDLGLSRCADTKVGNEFIRGVSGGERKRCNIGMELIISPPVLFLDEPTTGLDANTANTVLMFLRRLSRKGRTIIFSIHQPRFSIYRLFDNLLLLSQGVTVYHGPAREALDFFQTQEHNNPPDFFLDVINGDLRALSDDQAVDDDLESEPVSQHDKLVDGYRKSRWNQMLQSEVNGIFSEFESNGGNKGDKHEKIEYASGFGQQAGVLAVRSLRNLTRNPATAGITIGSTLLFSIIISLIFWQLGDSKSDGFTDREGVLFFLIMYQMFFVLLLLYITGKEFCSSSS
ncbi:ATP-binding cassette sub-family g member 2 [Plakobranchus ocellatus]|uniref:ATP-binding cassette sub-family g member 2 n=1 Tax=Plakobranchus ocellatus TaxID=259542 RepID=A0AAV4BP96_9GAST|nr:ATP-binding cassette sub-family g member 2 [Plakobranchus ocellatus]